MARSEIDPKMLERLSKSAEIGPWLDEIMIMTNADRRVTACRELAAVLHALRAQLPEAEANSLGSRLPPWAREAYEEHGQVHRAVDSRGEDAASNFVSSVADACPALNEQQVERAIWAVFTMLSHHVSPEVIRRVRAGLPTAIRDVWNTAA